MTQITTRYGVALLAIACVVAGTMYALVPTTSSPALQISTLTGTQVDLYHAAGCNCCTKYVRILEAAGANVTINEKIINEMDALKRSHDIAHDQQSCHTALIDGYIVEGHVPLAAVAKLITERPAIRGITLPGMPIGSPGMPGEQTESLAVTTLAGYTFWQE